MLRPRRVRQDPRSPSLIQGSFSARGISRRAPWVANLHRLSDGTLVGLGVCMLALSGLTFHWQARWGQSYRDLESTQVLEHRLQEATAQLEQNHLAAIKRPGWLVAARSEKLVFLPPPPRPAAAVPVGRALPLQLRTIPSGY